MLLDVLRHHLLRRFGVSFPGQPWQLHHRLFGAVHSVGERRWFLFRPHVQNVERYRVRAQQKIFFEKYPPPTAHAPSNTTTTVLWRFRAPLPRLSLTTTSYQATTFLTAFGFPGFIFAGFFIINLFVWGYGSSAALPFTSMLLVCCLWFGISVPLTFVGAFLGYGRDSYEHPTRVNTLPRQIPAGVRVDGRRCTCTESLLTHPHCFLCVLFLSGMVHDQFGQCDRRWHLAFWYDFCRLLSFYTVGLVHSLRFLFL